MTVKLVGSSSGSVSLQAPASTTGGANRVVTVDLHAGQIQGFFDMPVDNLYTAPLFAKYIKKKLNTKNSNNNAVKIFLFFVFLSIIQYST